jgi:hypothetical protein
LRSGLGRLRTRIVCGRDFAAAETHISAALQGFVRVSDGTRTRDRLDHNQELYLLSYAHREAFAM